MLNVSRQCSCVFSKNPKMTYKIAAKYMHKSEELLYGSG